MKTVVPQAISRQPLEVRCPARTTKDTRCAKPDIIEQDDQNVGRSRGWPQLPDCWKFGIRIFGIVGGQAYVRLVRDGENCSLDVVLCTHMLFFLGSISLSPRPGSAVWYPR